MAFGSYDIQDQPFNAMRRPRGIFSQPPVTNGPVSPPSVATPGGAPSPTGAGAGAGPNQARSGGPGPLPLITGANPPTPLNGGQGPPGQPNNFIQGVFGAGGINSLQQNPIFGLGMGRRMF